MQTRPVDDRAAAAGDTRPHAVVIGAGVGGLAIAIRLGAKGYRVTVVDRLDAPGGRAYTYRQDGFTFDAGPTIITAPYMLEELWTLCGERMADHVQLRPCRPVLPDLLRRRPVLHLQRRPRRDAGRGGAALAGGRRRLRQLPADERRHLPRGLRATGRQAVPQPRLHAARGGRPGAPAGFPLGVLARERALLERAPAHGLQLPSAAGRRQSVHDHVVSTA